jgi:predicted outer membrane repeat protein
VLTRVTFDQNSGDGSALFNDACSATLMDVTFDSNKGGGMFEGRGSSSSLKRVTFRGNSGGGGLYNQGDGTLTDVTFDHNTATFNGGGMQNLEGNPRLNNVTFSGNSAPVGGGMSNYGAGSPTLTNVTFSSNSASDKGGGLYSSGSIGGLLPVAFRAEAKAGGRPSLTNVTFSGNSAHAGGAIVLEGADLQVSESILWDDRTEVVDGYASSMTITDSIVAGGCPPAPGGPPSWLAIECSNVADADPLLQPLAENGGYTQTMALGSGSPAIDVGGVNSACASTDQRGVTRPQGRACDLGAYEAP